MTRAPAIAMAVLVIGAASVSAAAAAAARLDEAAVRAFLARQEAAWNGRDAQAFAATFASDAVFVDQSETPGGGVIVNGRSNLREATVQASRFFARARFRETSSIDRVTVSADGRSAQVAGRERTEIEHEGARPRVLCARVDQALALVHGRLLSRGQTETQVRCPH